MIMEHEWNNGDMEKQIIRKEIHPSAILSTSNLTQTNCVPISKRPLQNATHFDL
jgi:hypothetical protein